MRLAIKSEYLTEDIVFVAVVPGLKGTRLSSSLVVQASLNT